MCTSKHQMGSFSCCEDCSDSVMLINKVLNVILYTDHSADAQTEKLVVDHRKTCS